LKRHTSRCLAAFLIAALGGLTSRALADPTYTITDLLTLGGTNSQALAINDKGQIVGFSDTSGGSHAFLWDAMNGMQDLGTLGEAGSQALAINDNGQIAGFLETFSNGSHAFLWLPGDAYGLPAGLNDLGTLPGGTDSRALAINNLGQVAGWAITSSPSTHAFYWDGVLHDLHDLGDPVEGDSQAYGINDNGQVVGFGSVNGYDHAFLWDIKNCVKTDLGTLGGLFSDAYAINIAGQVVGSVDDG
jgi:probable HAF family extracellular repeat protein